MPTSRNKENIKVAIIDSDIENNQILLSKIKTNTNIEISNTFKSARKALRILKEEKVEVVLIDVINGNSLMRTDVIQKLKNAVPHIEVIIYTSHVDEFYILKSFRDGASGYMLKSEKTERIIDAIIEVKLGNTPISYKITRIIVESMKSYKCHCKFTKRESDILYLLCQGKCYAEISKSLFVGRNTVKYHLRNIYKKLHVTNKFEAILKVKEEKLI